MVGQSNLIAKLKSYSITTLPHSILLVGEKGCGKHTLIKELETFYKMSAFDITDSISFEAIQEINTCPVSHFYIIDMTKITEKQQNVILKFLEEPTSSTYIILITTSKSILLDTIINRCVTFEFEPYSQAQLTGFLPFVEDAEMLVKYCHTPGQVISTEVEKIKELLKLCDNIISNVGKARYPNVLKISQKFKEDDNLDLFYSILLEKLLEAFSSTGETKYKEMFYVTSKALKKHNNIRFNQELLLDSLMIELHEISRGK